MSALNIKYAMYLLTYVLAIKVKERKVIVNLKVSKCVDLFPYRYSRVRVSI